MKREDVRLFDRFQEYSVAERQLPHWAQAGTLCFITWRMADSLPAAVLQRLDAQVASVLRAHDLCPDDDWKNEVKRLSSHLRSRVQWDLFATRDKYLDAGYGRCLLAKPQHARQVLNSLQHFDEDRYFLTDAVVMPNHVHFLVAFACADTMLAQCGSWKRYTARKINAAENLRGEFWQVDQFDHLVRSEEELGRYRLYIKNNPRIAGLDEGQFLCFQKPL